VEPIDVSSEHGARRYIKDETVDVVFAKDAGALQSLEGPNVYDVGDAIVRAETGERWVVSRDRFVGKYLPQGSLAMGEDGLYRNIATPVWALLMDQAFSIARSANGDVLNGAAGDWLLQYAPGDYGVVQQQRFARVYRAQ
jgi:hypothetical protein